MLKPGNEPVDLSVDILSSIIFPISDFSWEEFRHKSHRRIGIDTADSLLRPRGIYAYKMQSSNTTPAGTTRRKTYAISAYGHEYIAVYVLLSELLRALKDRI